MVDCDYCGASFESEDAYLDHLADAHEGELGTIDQRRVDERDTGSVSEGIPTGPAVLVLVIGLSLALVVYVVVFMGGGSGTAGQQLPDQGDEAVISQVETHESEGRGHVSRDTDLNYKHMPPTSGPHYNEWLTGGFYEDPQPLGEVVHALEHGAVVVYYDPDGLSEDARQHMEQLGNRYTDGFQSFVAVPTPVDDPEATYVVTAWTKRIDMDDYDEETVWQFTAEYLGRGPERQVR